jgi:hypothetical protein
MHELIFNFLIWIVFWFVGWGVLMIIFKKRSDYIKNFIFVSVYYLVVSFIIIFSFRNIFGEIYNKMTIFPLVILLVFFIINFLEFFFSNRFLTKPIKFIEKFSEVTFLRMDYRYLISKSFDILFQQLLIIVLILIMYKSGMGIILITVIFSFLFGFGHVPIIKIHKTFFGYFYLAASLFSSFLFPYLIIHFKYGFIYTYIAHWLFYTNSGIFFWILKSEKDIAKERKIPESTVKEITNVQVKIPNINLGLAIQNKDLNSDKSENNVSEEGKI